MGGRDIFISYSTKDDAIARLACERLEQAGYSCWFAPRDIPPGEFYAGQIIQALRESRFVLLFFSEDSNASAQVVREINFAVSQRLSMLVVRLDSTPLNNDFEYLIRINQWLDVSHLANDQERVAQIRPQIAAGFAKLKTGLRATAPKAPVAMVFGDFEILADASGKPIELGRGGMGVTYRARQTSMGGREVALKVIQPDLLSDDNIRRRFLREAQLAGEIDHENVALVYLRGQEGDSYFYAMQLVEGIDLDRYIKAHGPLRVQDALSITAQVASALEAANSKGLIHRDIKPSNLMVVRRRNTLRVKLIDFGLAKDIRQRDIQSSILSGKVEFKGTLAFASPEQCKAEELDTRSDLYSLGVTLWFVLSGKVPFRGSIAEVSGSHLFAPLPLAELPPLPQPVLELLQSLLAKSPADRPQTPAEVEDRVQTLQRTLPSEPTAAQPAATGPVEAAEAEAAAPDPSATLVGAEVLSSYLEPAIGQIRDDRFELLESLPEGVSGRLFRAREHRGRDSRLVAVKFLHPSICAQEEAAEALKNQFAALHKLSHEHLLAYFALEIGSRPPFLVREWVNGLNLSAILRLKGGVLESPQTAVLLDPLPELLDTLASSGLSLVMVSLFKLWVRLPPELEESRFDSWVKQSPPDQWKHRLALDPLSLRSLVSKSVRSESDVTLIPTSRSLALQQNRAGIQGRTPAQLLASVIYELLSSRAPQSDAYRPLSTIPELANQTLKRGIAEERHFPSAAAFWQTFKTEIPLTPIRPDASTPQLSSGPVAQAPPPLPSRPIPPAYALPPRPSHESETKQSAADQTPAPQPAASRAKTRSFLWLWLVLAAFALLCAVGLLGTALLHGPGLPGPKPQPTSSPAATPKPTSTPIATPTPTPVPTITPTPTPTPSNDSLARAAFDRGLVAEEKGDHQQAIADYSEAIRLKPDYPEAFNNRGVAYYSLKQYDKALSDYNEAIRLKPDDAEAFKNRGNVYYGLKQYDKALSDYNEAIRLKPDYAYAFNNRACVYNDRKQYDKALSDYNEAIRLKPDYALAFCNRGNLYNDLEQYDKALSDYNEPSASNPTMPKPSTIAATSTLALNNTTRHFPITTRLSGSNPTTRWPSTVAATIT
jgi:serine/threonine protein kinase/Tfp pilus assembly protein PilF